MISSIVVFIEQYTSDDFKKNKSIDEIDIAKANEIIIRVKTFIGGKKL